MISAEEFIQVWQTSESVAEVSKKTGMERATCSIRARLYRKKGIPLQKFTNFRNGKRDWDALKALAESLNHKDDVATEEPGR